MQNFEVGPYDLHNDVTVVQQVMHDIHLKERPNKNPKKPRILLESWMEGRNDWKICNSS